MATRILKIGLETKNVIENRSHGQAGAGTRINPFQSVLERSEKAASPETSSRSTRSQRSSIYPYPKLSSSWLRLGGPCKHAIRPM
eukprot:3331464-Pyramimonas_sp.AAC.1